MLLVWLVLVLCMGGIVAHNADTEGAGNLFAFLFSRPQEPVSLPPVVTQLPAAPAPPPPAAAPTPPVEEPAPPQSEWIALHKGRKAGTGTLGKPQITAWDNGDVEVRFPCKDTPGEFIEFYPPNIDSVAIDLAGAWGKGMRVDNRLDTGVLKRVQIADHRQWVRVSGIAREAADMLEARVEYAPTHKALRIVFTKKR